jgi:hypothetical protein
MRDANMLRSEHIPLNLFIPMRENTEKVMLLFNSFFKKEIIQSIEDIHIEKAGNQNKSEYLDDGTSFDARIDFIHIDGGKGYIGIEVKYTEAEYIIKPDSKEYRDIFNKENKSYQTVTDKSTYYLGNKYDRLKQDDFRQIWRNHILGAAIQQSGEIQHFYHVHFYPKGNSHFVTVIPEYQSILSEKGKETFIPITYEDFFFYLEKIFNGNQIQINWINYLKTRYLF